MLRFALTVLMLVAATPIEAELSDLRGLEMIELAVDKLSADAEACGITEAAMRAAAMSRFGPSRLRVVQDHLSPVFMVAIMTVHGSDALCASALTVEITFLWSETVVLTGPADQHGRNVARAVEDLTKKFLTDWNLANTPAAH
jgi:hypothetical protein